MQWKISIDDSLISDALTFISDFLCNYNVDSLRYIKIESGNKKYEGVYGLCKFPGYNRCKDFRIDCYLPGPFPIERISLAKGYVYRKYGKWPKIDKKIMSYGTRLIKGRKRYWRRYAEKTRFNDINESCVWLLGHELFHFLRATKQIPGKNYETFADRFGDELLNRYRAQREIKINPA